MLSRQHVVSASLCLLAALTACSGDHKYYMSIDVRPNRDASTPGKNCTLYLGHVVETVLANRDHATREGLAPAFDMRQPPNKDTNNWTLRDFQIKLEHQLDWLTSTKLHDDCQEQDKSFFRKWLATYSMNGTDPDQDMDRFEEYLESVKRITILTQARPVLAEPNKAFQKRGHSASQWCGAPESAPCPPDRWALYKLISQVNEEFVKGLNPAAPSRETFEDLMLDRVRKAKDPYAIEPRPKRFHILGYELPWDEQETQVRYGITFYFEERAETASDPQKSRPLYFIGYRTIYANEATPQPRENPAGKLTKDEQFDRARTRPERYLHATGWPIAAVIGIKNAAFELTKIPFSWIGGVISGRSSALLFPWENVVNAGKTLKVELTSLPSYGFLTGLHQLLSEVPLVGQVVQLNTGPEYEDRGFPTQTVARKIFLSRGIYGGDELGQDTGLWAAYAQQLYKDYDVYAPPYKHGTAVDVVWSMFNLSHGPAYAEADYVMEKSGPFDHIYLSGHSGGVQRSTIASRILSNHGYSVVKVLGIAGPSIGQAYVDTRYANSFQIFLNTQSGANMDIVGKIGLVAYSFSTVMEYGLKMPVKYAAGALTTFDNDLQRCTYEFFDHMGFSNAEVIEVPRKRTTLHQTPLRLSLNEPIIFDAYIRSEFETAFREDLMRPSDKSLPKIYHASSNDELTDVLGKGVPSSKGCTFWEKEKPLGDDNGAVFEWFH